MQKKWTIYRERCQLSNWLLSLMTFNTVLVFCESSWVTVWKHYSQLTMTFVFFANTYYLHEFLKWARKKCDPRRREKVVGISQLPPNKLNWPNFSKTASILVIKVLMTLFTPIREVKSACACTIIHICIIRFH